MVRLSAKGAALIDDIKVVVKQNLILYVVKSLEILLIFLHNLQKFVSVDSIELGEADAHSSSEGLQACEKLIVSACMAFAEGLKDGSTLLFDKLHLSFVEKVEVSIGKLRILKYQVPRGKLHQF